MTPEEIEEIVKKLEDENGRPIRVDYYGGIPIIDVFMQAKKLILERLMEDRIVVKVIMEQDELGYHVYVFSMEFIQ